MRRTAELLARRAGAASSHAHDGAPHPPDDPDGTRGTRIEAALVALTLAGLVGGVVAERAGAPVVAWVCWILAYVAGGLPAARNGLASLAEWHLDVDILMVLAALGALVIGAPSEGATLLFLFALSNLLQRVALGRSRRAIRALMKLRPDTARVRRNGEESTVPVEDVAIGEVYVVHPGERMPLDGVVADGRGEVDQAMLTGESVPVEKTQGDDVFAGTLNGGGALVVRVTRLSGASALARMVELVEEAQAEKAGAQRLIDRLESPYALAVIVATILAVVIPVVVLSQDFPPAFYRAMALMVAASPCAVVIATPAAMLSAIAAAGRQGVLFKGGAPVEAAAAVRCVAFDKTGTLTEGSTYLTAVVPLDGGGTPEELIAMTAAVQKRSEHHIARAVVAAANERGLDTPEAQDFRAEPGLGVSARVEGRHVHAGNQRYFASMNVEGLPAAIAEVERLESEGKTAVVVATSDGSAGAPARAVAVMAFADRVRSTAPAVVAELRRLGITHVALITGDNEAVARRVGEAVGVDSIHAAVLPERKVELVRALRAQYGGVAMVGDGVNDAPALAAATLGVAMGGAGTDVALEAADLVLMGDDLTSLPYALALGRAARRTVAISLAFALGVVVVLAATVLFEGLALPMAVIGHEGSTVLVALNGLRMLRFRRENRAVERLS